MIDQQSFFHARRIGLSGSQTPATKEFLAFCNEIGQALAKIDNVKIAIAGRKSTANGDSNSADQEFVDGMRQVLRKGEGRSNLADRVETYKFKREPRPRDYFQAGKAIVVNGTSRESRRFSMVHASNGLIGVGGTKGTGQQLTFAFATETPALPVPAFGGSSREIWDDHRDLLIKQLGLTEEKAENWETPPKNETAARKLANEMVEIFLNSLQQRCFVIMPFAEAYSPLIDFVIDPVVRGLGDEPIHLGRRAAPGDIGEQISNEIAKADYVICVLDGMRPNVLYELGFAHALKKPAVLLWKKGESEVKAPFDIAQEQRIEYEATDQQLIPRLENAIRHIKNQLLDDRGDT